MMSDSFLVMMAAERALNDYVSAVIIAGSTRTPFELTGSERALLGIMRDQLEAAKLDHYRRGRERASTTPQRT